MATKTSTRKRSSGSSKTSGSSAGARGRKAASSSSRARTKSASSSARAGTKTGGSSARPRTLSKTTTDHDTIRRWAESRDAQPACVKGTGRGKNDVGMVRMDLPGYSGEDSLQPLSWDEFFEAFDKNNLAFVYQEKTAGGKKSNFNKFVSRERARKTA
jgi:hypothetical protein